MSRKLIIKPIPQANDMVIDDDFKSLPASAYLPRPDAKILMVGVSGSGKSTLVYSLMREFQNEGKRPYYDYVYVYSGTPDSNAAWMKINNTLIYNRFNKNRFKKLLDDIEREQTLRTDAGIRPLRIFMIFDDLIASAHLMDKSGRGWGVMEGLSMTCRHHHIGYAILTQRYANTSHEVRTCNVDVITIHKVTQHELDTIAKEHSGFVLDKDQFKKLYRKIVKNDNYGFMVVDYTEPDHKKRFSKGFDTQITIKTQPGEDDEGEDDE